MNNQGPVAVIGSRGRMGAFFLRRLAEEGLGARGADLPLLPQELATACQDTALVLLCVPAAHLDATLEKILPHVPATAVLADITSVKMQPMEQMEKAFAGPVVGTHPLFGPVPAEGAELPVAIVPGKNAGEEHLALVEAVFTRLSCRVFRTTAALHDEAMAAIQGLNFISSLAYFATLAQREELLPFLTPSFRRRSEASRKLLTEDASLFAGLFEANPYSHELVRQYRNFLNIAAAGDIELLAERAGWWWEGEGGAKLS